MQYKFIGHAEAQETQRPILFVFVQSPFFGGAMCLFVAIKRD